MAAPFYKRFALFWPVLPHTGSELSTICFVGLFVLLGIFLYSFILFLNQLSQLRTGLTGSAK